MPQINPAGLQVSVMNSFQFWIYEPTRVRFSGALMLDHFIHLLEYSIRIAFQAWIEHFFSCWNSLTQEYGNISLSSCHCYQAWPVPVTHGGSRSWCDIHLSDHFTVVLCTSKNTVVVIEQLATRVKFSSVTTHDHLWLVSRTIRRRFTGWMVQFGVHQRLTYSESKGKKEK